MPTCLYMIKEIYNSYQFSHISDAKFLIQYINFNLDLNLNSVSLFDNTNKDNWEFFNIYFSNIYGNRIYFILEKVEEYFSFHEITEEDAIQYTRYYRGINKELIYRNTRYY